MSSEELSCVALYAADGMHAKLRRGIRKSTRCDMMEKSHGKEPVGPTSSTRIRFFIHHAIRVPICWECELLFKECKLPSGSLYAIQWPP